MRSCTSLVYLHSTRSGHSKWMPWELGYLDDHNDNVAIFPVLKGWKSTFEGQEYLGIYPCIESDNPGREETGGGLALQVPQPAESGRGAAWLSSLFRA